MMRIAWLQNKSLFLSLIVLVAGGAVIPGYAQQQRPVLLRFNFTVGNYSLPYLVAYEEGIFKKNGIDLQPSITGELAERRNKSGIIIPPELVSPGGERSPFSLAGAAPAILRAATEPRPLKTVIIASNCDYTDWVLISRKDITKPEQLKGKRIGYQTVGTISWFMALVFAKKMGWDPVQDVSLISDAWNLDVLRDGSVDAIITTPITSIVAMAEGGFSALADFRDQPWREPLASNALHVDKVWLQDNRETARRVVKSLVEGIALVKKDKQATFRAMAKWYNLTDPQVQAALYTFASQNRKPYPTVEGIKKVMEVYDSHAMRKFKPEDFYDDSFVRELDQSGFIDSLYK
jgi:ABC-type nitrate/sulfonate/bicarbonate transport system substrate-binding protein